MAVHVQALLQWARTRVSSDPTAAGLVRLLGPATSPVVSSPRKRARLAQPPRTTVDAPIWRLPRSVLVHLLTFCDGHTRAALDCAHMRFGGRRAPGARSLLEDATRADVGFVAVAGDRPLARPWAWLRAHQDMIGHEAAALPCAFTLGDVRKLRTVCDHANTRVALVVVAALAAPRMANAAIRAMSGLPSTAAVGMVLRASGAIATVTGRLRSHDGVVRAMAAKTLAALILGDRLHAGVVCANGGAAALVDMVSRQRPATGDAACAILADANALSVRRGLEAIGRLCQSGPVAREAVHEADGVGALVAHLNVDAPSALAATEALLHGCRGSKRWRTALVDANGPYLLLALLRNGTPFVAGQAVQLLSALALTTDAADAVLDAPGALAALVVAARSEYPCMWRHAFGALRALVLHREEASDALRELGGLDAAVERLRERAVGRDHDERNRAAADLIAALVRNNERNRDALRGASDALVHGMTASSPPATARFAIAIANACYDHPANQTAMVAAGAAGALVTALRAPGSGAMPNHGRALMGALMNLCDGHAAAQAAVLAADGAVALVAQTHGPRCASTLRLAAMTMHNLCLECPEGQTAVWKAGGATELARLLRFECSSVAIQAADALRAVCAGRPRIAREAVDAGATTSLCRQLRDAPTSRGRGAAADALAALATACPSIDGTVGGDIDALVRLLEDPDEYPRVAAADALTALVSDHLPNRDAATAACAPLARMLRHGATSASAARAMFHLVKGHAGNGRAAVASGALDALSDPQVVAHDGVAEWSERLCAAMRACGADGPVVSPLPHSCA